jgi:Uma2 family endonuclease
MATATDPQLRPSSGPGGTTGADDDFVPPPGDIRYEVVDGTIVELPMGTSESELAFLIALEITQFAKPRGLGSSYPELLFRLIPGKNQRRRPDVAFLSAAKWPVGKRVPRGESWQVVPDLAVEVVSPTDSAEALERKIDEYFEAGVAAVWVVYPTSRKVYAYSSPTDVRILTPPAELDGGEVIPGFRLPLARLFEDDPGLAGS